MARWHARERFPLRRGRKFLPMASAFAAGMARIAPHGSTQPEELVQGSDPRLRGGGIGYRFYPGGIGEGGGGYGALHNQLCGLQGGKSPNEYYHVPLLTQGAIPFADGNGVLTQDPANLFWDAVNKRLGIGTNAPAYPLHVSRDEAGGLTGFSVRNANAGAGAFVRDMLFSSGGDAYRLYRVPGPLYWGVGERAADGVYIISAGVSLAAPCLLLTRAGEVQVGGGSPSSPSHSFLDEPGIGVYRSGARRAGLSGGLTASGTIATQGAEGYPSGTGPGAELRYAAGRASLLGYNRGGGAYEPVELRGSEIWFSLSGVDRASMKGWGILWQFPYDVALAAEGEQAYNSVTRAHLSRIGSVTKRLAGQRWEKHTTTTVGEGSTAEADLASDTVLGATWGAVKAIEWEWSGRFNVAGAAGAASSIRVRIKIGGTAVLSELIESGAAGDSQTYGAWDASLRILCGTKSASGNLRYTAKIGATKESGSASVPDHVVRKVNELTKDTTSDIIVKITGEVGRPNAEDRVQCYGGKAWED